MGDLKLRRRVFLERVAKITGAISIANTPIVSAVSKNENNDLEHKFLTKPYLQNPVPGQITVKFITNKPTYSWVEYGTDENLGNKSHTVNLGLVTANNRIHGITLKNLKPGQRYYYKVLSKDFKLYNPYEVIYGETIESKVYSFTSFDVQKEDFSMLIMNDLHERPKAIEQLVELHGKQSFDMVLFNGDIFNYHTDEAQIIDKMINQCTASFATQIPFLYVRGNHEVRGKFARHVQDYFDNIDKRQYFTFTRGPVYFICLDTGEDKIDDHREHFGLAAFDAYREEQALWLEEQLKSKEFKRAKYKVVLMHIPHYHFREAHGVMQCRKLFGPLLNKHKIHLMICGHTHKYGFYEPEAGKHNFPMFIGGGPIKGKRTLIHLSANKERLSVVMKKDDGEEVARYSVSK